MWQRRSPICGAVHDSASPAAATPGQFKTVNPKQNKRKASSFDCETKDGDAAAAAQKRKLDDMPATFEQAAAEEERRVPTPAAESDDEELTCERHEQQAANTPVPSTPEHTYEVPTTANAKAPSCTNNNNNKKNKNNINQGLINLKTLQKLIDLCLTRLFLPQQLATPLISRVTGREPLIVDLVWSRMRKDNGEVFEKLEMAAEKAKNLRQHDMTNWNAIYRNLVSYYDAYRSELESVASQADKVSVYPRSGDVVQAEKLVSSMPTSVEEAMQYEEAPLLLCDENSVVWHVNEAWARLTDYKPEECIGHRINDLIRGSDTDRQAAACLTRAAVKCDLGLAAATLTNYKKDGVTPFRNRVYVTRLRKQQNLFVGLSIPLSKDGTVAQV